MATESYNPKQLKDAILRRLGAPITNIEVTTEQVYDCIQRALELYGEYHYNGYNKGYQAFYIGHDDVSQQKFRDGVFDLKGRNIFAVTQIIRTNVGSLTSMDGQATYPWFTDFVLGQAGINGGMGSSCNSFGPNAFGADLGIDGRIGPLTRLRFIAVANNPKYTDVLRRALDGLQVWHYINLGLSKSSKSDYRKYTRGWLLNRVGKYDEQGLVA